MLSNIEKHKEVYYITKRNQSFSSTYIDTRKKEERVYSDQIVKFLPKILSNHRYYNEWKLRQKSTKRIVEYLKIKSKPLKILDLGCGNGWFSNQLSLIPNSTIFAVDVNEVELEQAARVFAKTNLSFLYADIFSSETDVLSDFDIITVNSCIQYFENLDIILSRLKSKLNKGGELHIIDSPFYTLEQLKNAKERTKAYYLKLGVPEMANYYFHHSIDDLGNYNILYNPKKSLLNKILRKKDSPFMWIQLSKSN